jgi:hypothetical protein
MDCSFGRKSKIVIVSAPGVAENPNTVRYSGHFAENH